MPKSILRIPIALATAIGLSALVMLMTLVMPTSVAAEEPTVVEGVEVGGSAAPESSLTTELSLANTRDVYINFDDLVNASCVFIQTTRLTTRYTGQGVTFSGPGGNDGGAILDECGGFSVTGHSAPNFLAFNTGAVMSDGGTPRGPETLRFDPPVQAVEIIAGSRNAGTITMEAFDASDGLVDSKSLGGTSTMQTMVVQGGTCITRAVISITGSVLVVDDLGFDICSPPSVGGATQFLAEGSDSSARGIGTLAGIVAAFVVLVTGGWYARRRWLGNRS